MSADNVIYVKQYRNKWKVWHDFMSNDNPKPTKIAKSFDNFGDAVRYAFDLEKEIGYVEYGVAEL